MRSLILVPAVVLVAACGSRSSQAPEPATSGPIGSIVHATKDAVQLKAVRHEVALAELPVKQWLSLPLVGMVVLDADLTVPIVNGTRDYRAAKGTVGLRCKGRCTIGDDVTKLKVSDDPDAFVTALDFGHIDFDQLEATAVVADGKARLSHWVLTSPDIAVHVELSIDLAAQLDQSHVSGCVRYKPSEALKQRDPKTATLLSLVGGALGPDGSYNITVEGQADQLKPRGELCKAATP